MRKVSGKQKLWGNIDIVWQPRSNGGFRQQTTQTILSSYLELNDDLCANAVSIREAEIVSKYWNYLGKKQQEF